MICGQLVSSWIIQHKLWLHLSSVWAHSVKIMFLNELTIINQCWSSNLIIWINGILQSSSGEPVSFGKKTSWNLSHQGSTANGISRALLRCSEMLYSECLPLGASYRPLQIWRYVEVIISWFCLNRGYHGDAHGIAIFMQFWSVKCPKMMIICWEKIGVSHSIPMVAAGLVSLTGLT